MLRPVVVAPAAVEARESNDVDAESVGEEEVESEDDDESEMRARDQGPVSPASVSESEAASTASSASSIAQTEAPAATQPVELIHIGPLLQPVTPRQWIERLWYRANDDVKTAIQEEFVRVSSRPTLIWTSKYTR